jgi:hypothetical protein
MFCQHNPSIASINFIDGLIFTRDDPCLWVVYPSGAAGDLLIAILDRHYLRTGCEYYGIDDRGRVMIYSSDYEMIDIALANNQSIEFNDQWFYDFSDQLGNRNLTYSMLDQVIFGCHLYRPQDIKKILDNFKQARVINIYPQDRLGDFIIRNMSNFKLRSKDPEKIMASYQKTDYQIDIIQHERVLNVPFGFLFDRSSYDRYYADIRKFLGLKGPLICFEYVEFYLSKQNAVIQKQLQKYSQST